MGSALDVAAVTTRLKAALAPERGSGVDWQTLSRIIECVTKLFIILTPYILYSARLPSNATTFNDVWGTPYMPRTFAHSSRRWQLNGCYSARTNYEIFRPAHVGSGRTSGTRYTTASARSGKFYSFGRRAWMADRS
ncbi:hypothetical protein MVEN_01411500 [Mycena venus]|uniref:Uncharacterized protein n=1 Tax=Mycena venus TaxID=2733690 RepID=A0A8H7CUP5_9AGAR|nr:hypothetical protein MVEN_01411500 [Mycena venus]